VYLLIHRAHTHLQLEEYERARSLLLEAIQYRESLDDPGATSFILSGLDATYLLTERFNDGIMFFSKYIARYPEDPDAYSGRAASLWYTGRFHDAIRDYSRALELKPNHLLSLSGRGQVLAEAGEFRSALQDLDLALSILKTAPAPDATWTKWYEQIEAFVRNGKGFALAGLGENASAVSEFEMSIRLSPENAWVYHNRAQVYERAGDREAATTDYRLALTKKSPALSPLRKKLAEARLSELSRES